MLTGDERGNIDIWNTQNLEKSTESVFISDSPIHSLEFSPNNVLLAVGSEDGIVKMYAVMGEKINFIQDIPGQRSRVNSIKFSNDGALMATASFDGTVQLWVMNEMNTMLPVAFKDHEDYVWSIEFDATSNYLMAGTKTGVLKLWPTRMDLMTQDICKYLFRNMSKKAADDTMKDMQPSLFSFNWRASRSDFAFIPVVLNGFDENPGIPPMN